MNRRTLGIATALVAAIALAVVAALALGGGDDEEPSEAASATVTSGEGATPTEPGITETEAQPEDGPDGATTEEEPPPQASEPESQPAPQPDPARAPAAEPARYVPYSSSSGDWQAELPAGNGWRAPKQAQLGGGRRYRVTVRGPAGAVLLIEHIPSAAARFGSKYRSRRELSQPWFGSMTEYRLADTAVGYVLNASEAGPGFRVFATGVEGPVARRVADSLTFVDL